jgi:hypothetical protein
MTQIIMRRSDDPTTCMCCGRHAHSLGVAKPRQPMTTWTCDNPECLKATQGLIMADPKTQDGYETRAVDAVARASVEGVLKECMDAMFAAGATDLTSLTAEQIDSALDGLIVNGAMQIMVKDIVLKFGDHIRADVLNNAPPF